MYQTHCKGQYLCLDSDSVPIKTLAMRHPLNYIIAEIQKQERKLSAETHSVIAEAYKMTIYLQELLHTVKEDVVNEGFSSKDEEIHFFKQVKPNILGKLIYYNKVYRIETARPVENGNLCQNYKD